MTECSSAFNRLLRDITDHNATLKHIRPYNFGVTTMTIYGSLSETINVATINRAVQVGLFSESPKKRAREEDFFNQASVYVGNACVKLFSNGSVQCTGAKSPVHFLDIVDGVSATVGDIFEAPPPTFETATIGMINAGFSLARTVPLAVAQAAFQSAGCLASYDTDVSNTGVVVKIPIADKFVTAMIFASGSVILTGGKTPAEIGIAYCKVCTVIDALGPGQPGPLPKFKPSSIPRYDIVDGYHVKIANLCPEYFL